MKFTVSVSQLVLVVALVVDEGDATTNFDENKRKFVLYIEVLKFDG